MHSRQFESGRRAARWQDGALQQAKGKAVGGTRTAGRRGLTRGKPFSRTYASDDGRRRRRGAALAASGRPTVASVARRKRWSQRPPRVAPAQLKARPRKHPGLITQYQLSGLYDGNCAPCDCWMTSPATPCSSATSKRSVRLGESPHSRRRHRPPRRRGPGAPATAATPRPAGAPTGRTPSPSGGPPR